MATDQVAVRVRQVIQESGLSQAEFARKAGLDGPKMSKSLSGVRRFTSLDLARIAEVAGVTVDSLLGTAGAAPAAAARSVTASSADVALDQARRFAEIRADLAFLGYDRKWPGLAGPPVTGRLFEQGIRLAEQASAVARAADHDPAHTRDLGGLVEAVFQFDVAVVELPDGFDGLSWCDAHTKLIVVGTSRVPARQRFTIAHELGHLLAGDDQEVHLDPDLRSAEHRRKPSEVRANAFAAAFLMPEAVVIREGEGAERSDEVFARLACKLWVSPSTLAWRLLNLGMIGADRCAALRHMSCADAASRAGHMGEFAEWIETASAASLPRLLVQDSYQAYADGRSTLRPFANLLGVDTDALRESLEETSEEIPLLP